MYWSLIAKKVLLLNYKYLHFKSLNMFSSLLMKVCFLKYWRKKCLFYEWISIWIITNNPCITSRNDEISWENIAWILNRTFYTNKIWFKSTALKVWIWLLKKRLYLHLFVFARSQISFNFLSEISTISFLGVSLKATHLIGIESNHFFHPVN